MFPKTPKVKKLWGTPLETFDVPLTEVAVLRLAKKIDQATEYFDLRIWLKSRNGVFYPKRGQGLCLKQDAWLLAFKLFKEKYHWLSSDRTEDNSGTTV